MLLLPEGGPRRCFVNFATFLKPDSHLAKKIIFICINENHLKIMKNAFYFILKALGPKHHTKGVDQRKLRRADILAFFICIYVYTNFL